MPGCPIKIKNKFLCIIVPCIVGIATSGLIFQFQYFLPALQKQSTRIFLQTSAVVLYIMAFISYYFAINIKNEIPPTLIPPRIKHQLKNNHPLYTEKKLCQKQGQRYKPPRTSHCHICKCVARMDHHCPYTNNCVGARNLKAFILFCAYGGLFALQFFILSIVFYFKLASGKIQKMSELAITIWMILTFIAFLLSFSMNGLAISNIMIAGKNVTQIEMLKGTFIFRDKHGMHPNPYDLGFFTNLNNIFGGDYWLFWWPTPIKSENDFTEYPMRPPVTNAQFKTLPEQVQKQLQDPITKLIPKTIQQLRKKEQSNYQGVIFFYLGKPYQLTREQLKQTLAEINDIKIDEAEEETKDNSKKKQQFQPTQQDKQILADLYDQ